MNAADSLLDVIEVASPCTADWNQMQGDDRVRFCSQCKLNVYCLSNMTQDEAEALIRHHEGRLCVRFWRRADGTVLTRDCPVGLRALRRSVIRLAAATLGLVVLLIGAPVLAFSSYARRQTSNIYSPLLELLQWREAYLEPVLMGDVCIPPTGADPILEADEPEAAPLEEGADNPPETAEDVP